MNKQQFSDLYRNCRFAENDTLEILNCSFIADAESIFGNVDWGYVAREIQWYESQSRNVQDIPGKTPKIWEQVADRHGNINSNYGWCIWSGANKDQYRHAIETLLADKYSRQAQMIYTRPSMHSDSVKNGMYDFMCTNTTQLVIRENKLHYIVHMRSSDAVFGYKNDRAWHVHVWGESLNDLKEKYPNLVFGNLYWNAASFHVYPRHYKLIEEFNVKSGQNPSLD